MQNSRKVLSSRSDQYFKGLILLLGVAIIAIFGLSLYELLVGGWDALKTYGAGFLSNTIWDVPNEKFGALTFIVGTLITSVAALLISVLLAVPAAIFVTEYAPKWLSEPVSYLIELLAAIPSVIYGLWAIVTLVPLVQKLQLAIVMDPNLQKIPWLMSAPTGRGLFTAILVLSIMVIPYTASVARDVIRLVPADQREAAYALGATKWEVISMAILPYARAGIFGGVILSLGRALGETMAVTMVIGNNNAIPHGIFDATNTMASVIATQFQEATSDLQLSSLLGIGLLLFIISVIVNYLARLIIARLTPKGIK
ncbi:phosphate ABC transporter permease subunit PstC [Deinococcus cellulosilyticus]|uniref:Phosphate transport system permease protein n=1 Tax=Deinococcus cellulosilyticus (strain DSM 18568 / NBRC 106333 / KACC 11606 / 5516J-15) TaxID=1223518 RepID=A0A511N810_DEIC1|nr:phosphate ABC transporter permease subunit PstC [Deinococcus cellulosilyticus]GEM48973.1 phosphate transport system permease protein [Deinococcus cellulosilyticus NBRC 106333 = KACC 11606]